MNNVITLTATGGPSDRDTSKIQMTEEYMLVEVLPPPQRSVVVLNGHSNDTPVTGRVLRSFFEEEVGSYILFHPGDVKLVLEPRAAIAGVRGEAGSHVVLGREYVLGRWV